MDINELQDLDLAGLKELAIEKGFKHNKRIGEAKLKVKLTKFLFPKESDEDEDDSNETTSTVSKEKTKRQTFAERKKRANQLVRVRVACMNPNKKDWPGEIISVGSAKLGTYKKYVPFNTKWHVPQIICDAMLDRNCSIFYTVKSPRGDKVRKARQINEFNVEILKPLTDKEVKDLATQQAMSGSIEQ